MQYFYAPFEVKADPNDDTGMIRGYGSVFGNIDSYGDSVAKGAFTNTISDIKSGAASWPAMLLNHGRQDKNPVGVWDSVEQDDRGLKLRGRLALKTKRGLEVYNLLTMTPRPALNGLSIGYRAKDYELHKRGPVRMTLKSVELVEISLCSFPADKFARVASVKSWQEEEPVDEAISMKDWAAMEFEKMRRLMNHVPR